MTMLHRATRGVAQLAQPAALDLLDDTQHDAVIADAAWAAVAR
jgi:hypothetical protein